MLGIGKSRVSVYFFDLVSVPLMSRPSSRPTEYRVGSAGVSARSVVFVVVVVSRDMTGEKRKVCWA